MGNSSSCSVPGQQGGCRKIRGDDLYIMIPFIKWCLLTDRGCGQALGSHTKRSFGLCVFWLVFFLFFILTPPQVYVKSQENQRIYISALYSHIPSYLVIFISYMHTIQAFSWLSFAQLSSRVTQGLFFFAGCDMSTCSIVGKRCESARLLIFLVKDWTLHWQQCWYFPVSALWGLLLGCCFF